MWLAFWDFGLNQMGVFVSLPWMWKNFGFFGGGSIGSWMPYWFSSGASEKSFDLDVGCFGFPKGFCDVIWVSLFEFL